ncbi:hypothetical protein [Streptomyces bobili]|uniref:hypothetical protein n=1 Tax=Streptomyces bobili TaxID=67280 RepID=UPI00381BAC5C
MARPRPTPRPAAPSTPSAAPLHPSGLANHFGPAWPALKAAKQKYDPQGILVPGQGIWSTTRR